MEFSERRTVRFLTTNQEQEDNFEEEVDPPDYFKEINRITKLLKSFDIEQDAVGCLELRESEPTSQPRERVQVKVHPLRHIVSQARLPKKRKSTKSITKYTERSQPQDKKRPRAEQKKTSVFLIPLKLPEKQEQTIYGEFRRQKEFQKRRKREVKAYKQTKHIGKVTSDYDCSIIEVERDRPNKSLLLPKVNVRKNMPLKGSQIPQIWIRRQTNPSRETKDTRAGAEEQLTALQLRLPTNMTGEGQPSRRAQFKSMRP